MVTYLYVKKHSTTGMLYFGKTSKQCPYTYLGSGLYWKRHIKVHGKQGVETLKVWRFDDPKKCRKYALRFSRYFNIADSSLWANLKFENGSDGTIPGSALTIEHRAKIAKALRGRKRRPLSDETKEKIATKIRGQKRGPRSEEWKKERSAAMMGENNPNYGKPISDSQRQKLSVALKGRVVSEETRTKMKESALRRETSKRQTTVGFSSPFAG